MSKVKNKTECGRQSAVDTVVSGVLKKAKNAEKHYDKYTELCKNMKGDLRLFVNLPDEWGFEYRDDDACFVLCYNGFVVELSAVHNVLRENGVFGHDDLLAESH